MAVRSGYEDVDVIRDADRIVAVISKRKKDGKLAVGFFKEFDRDGEPERTSFVQRRHLDSLLRLIPIVADRMDQIADRSRAAEAAPPAAPAAPAPR